MKNRLLCIAVFSSIITVSALAGQEAAQPTPTPGQTEAIADSIVVTATRFDIPLDQSPATISVIEAQDLEIKQIERVADALNEVPGLSVVETGAPGQLTSVFTRGLNSAHTQVLLDGIPINQGLSGAMNFADLTTDNVSRIEVARGPQSTLYGPSAAAGVIQIFTTQGDGPPRGSFSVEGGSFDTFRETFQSEGRIQQFDYSIGASNITTDNDRPNNQYPKHGGSRQPRLVPKRRAANRRSLYLFKQRHWKSEHDFRSTPLRQPLDRALVDRAEYRFQSG